MEGRPCPCAPGHLCCARTNACVRAENLARLCPEADAAAPAPDAGSEAPRPDRDAAAERISDGPPDVATPGADAAGGDAGPDAASTSDGSAAGRDLAPDAPGAPRCSNGGGGLHATYFAGDELFGGFSTPRSEPVLSYSTFSFLARELSYSKVNAVFTGDLEPESSDLHTFSVVSDGAVRMWIGDDLVLDAWDYPCCLGGLAVHKRLEAGRRYPVQLELFGIDQSINFSLSWATSQNPTLRPVPPCALFERTGEPSKCPKTFGDCVPEGTPACTLSADNGIEANYFDTPDFMQPPRTQVDALISSGSPMLVPPVGAQSVRWRTDLVPPTSERYTLYLTSLGPTTVRLDGLPILATPLGPPKVETEVEVVLVQGHRHRLEVEHRWGGTSLWIKLRWKSATVPQGIIGKCRFFLPAASAGATDGGSADAAGGQ
jgi:hypothetical protein